MTIRATYRQARIRIGWVWTCYSHPKRIWRWRLREPEIRRTLHAHLVRYHASDLED